MMFKTMRRDVCDAVSMLDRQGLLPAGLGCVSALDREQGVMLIPPAAVPAEALTPEMLLVVDRAGKVDESRGLALPPDLETHLALYQSFPEICGLVSSYGLHSVRFAQAERAIPCFGAVHARFFKGEIPVTRALRKPEVERHYARSIGAVVVERFARLNPAEMPAVLVARQGAISWGKSVAAAATSAVALEQVARIAYGSLMLDEKLAPVQSGLVERLFTGLA